MAKKTTYVATAPDGSTHTRTSARTYTHAVLVFGTELVRQGAPERAMSLTKNASIVTEPASGSSDQQQANARPNYRNRRSREQSYRDRHNHAGL